MDIKSLKRKFREKARKKMAAEMSRDDIFLIQAEKTIEMLTKVANSVYERLDEWYRIYYNEKIKNPEKLIARIKGARREDFYYSYVVGLADLLEKILDERSELQKAVEKTASEIAPNLSALIGPKLAAKLIALAKGLERLASLPASTIQVLGAEKALFKHIRSKGKVKPPKHGILLLSPYVHTLPKRLRGKMARTLAAKLAIAAKADLAKHNIAEKLKKAVEVRYNELREKARRR